MRTLHAVVFTMLLTALTLTGCTSDEASVDAFLLAPVNVADVQRLGAGTVAGLPALLSGDAARLGVDLTPLRQPRHSIGRKRLPSLPDDG